MLMGSIRELGKFSVMERWEEGAIHWWKEDQHPTHPDVENLEKLTRLDVAYS